MVALLKAHRATQAAERLRAGQHWTDHGLVFTTETGGIVAAATTSLPEQIGGCLVVVLVKQPDTSFL